jgi:hypothetical protein
MTSKGTTKTENLKAELVIIGGGVESPPLLGFREHLA